MATIGYILLVTGASILGLDVLGFMAWSIGYIIETVRKKEFGDVVVPFIFLGILIFMIGIACVAIAEAKQRQQIKEPVVINTVQWETR